MIEMVVGWFILWLFFMAVRWLANFIRKVFQSSPGERLLTRAGSGIKGAKPQSINIDADPEFEEKERVLDLFLEVQKTLIGGPSLPGSLLTDLERSKYLHFVLGAMDQLSRTIKDPSRAYLWWSVNALGHGIGVFGAAAEACLEKYGNPDDVTLFQSSSRGAEAMRTFILSSTSSVSEEDYKLSCLEMFNVVRGANESTFISNLQE